MSLRSAAFIAAFAVTASITGAAFAKEQDKAAEAAEAVEPQAPLQMLVSLKEQKIKVYRGTDLIETSVISSGKRGHSTPTGVFSILEKRRKHFSNLYNSAPMPFMQRLTWSGVAMHQGHVPNYPASHGCIRLPRAFAKELFGMTERGLHVVVTKDATEPELIRHPALPQPLQQGTPVASLSSDTIAADVALRGSVDTSALETDLATRQTNNPYFDQPLRMIVTWRQPPNEKKTLQTLLNKMGFNAGPADGIIGRKTKAAISLFQEGADLPVTGNLTQGLIKRVYAAAGYEEEGHNATLRIRRKFQDIYQAPVTLKDEDKKIGTFVYTALGFAEGDSHVDWMAVPAEGEQYGTPIEILDRLEISNKVRREIGKILTPGSSLIITDRSFARNTGLGTDFVVVTR